MKISCLIAVLVGLLLVSGCGSKPASPAVTPTPTATPTATATPTLTPTPTAKPVHAGKKSNVRRVSSKVSVPGPQGFADISVPYIPEPMKGSFDPIDQGLYITLNPGHRAKYEMATDMVGQPSRDGYLFVGMPRLMGKSYTALHGRLTDSTGKVHFFEVSGGTADNMEGDYLLFHEGNNPKEGFGKLGEGTKIHVVYKETGASPKPLPETVRKTPPPTEPSAQYYVGASKYAGEEGVVAIDIDNPNLEYYTDERTTPTGVTISQVTTNPLGKPGQVKVTVDYDHVIVGGEIKRGKTPDRFDNSDASSSSITLDESRDGRLHGYQISFHVKKVG